METKYKNSVEVLAKTQEDLKEVCLCVRACVRACVRESVSVYKTCGWTSSQLSDSRADGPTG